MESTARVTRRVVAWLLCVGLLGLPGYAPASGWTTVNAAPGSQGPGNGSRTFPATGKTVQGLFLTYWDVNGGLPQQGYPISDEFAEVSDLDGTPYTVQYFERAVFEYHPEIADPRFQVLLAQLGAYQYRRKYPGGAPGQRPNTAPGSLSFPETGKRLGGLFLAYWQRNGGLAQQGYPISDEFTEVSEVDGKPYTVQYFERAVFEAHPENTPPYDILLSLLGALRYQVRYQQPAPPTATIAPTPPPPTEPPTPAPPPLTSTPEPGLDCAGIPENVYATVSPNCGRPGTVAAIRTAGFQPGEPARVCLAPPGSTTCGYGTPATSIVLPDGTTLGRVVFQDGMPRGVWSISFTGQRSGHQAVGYFKIVP